MSSRQKVTLRSVTRDDVSRIRRWLDDDEVSGSWFGRYSYGEPAHLGYRPQDLEHATDEEFARAFEDESHVTLSVYTESDEHIGEVHISLEEVLGDGQLSILIGRKDLWRRGYGTSGVRAALDAAFDDYGLYRVWVDIPEYNLAARAVFDHIGFVHEGTLRKSRPHEGSRHDSVVMGILAAEYLQRSGDGPAGG